MRKVSPLFWAAAAVLAAALTLGSCQSITFEDEEIDGAARMPASGSSFLFRCTAAGAKDSTLERVTINLAPGDDFVATRSANGLVVGADTFHVRTDGDLESANENEVYPIGTLGSYVISSTEPRIIGGISKRSYIQSEFRYDGSDKVMVGDSTYLCSRIRTKTAFRPESGGPSHDVSVTYWYCSRFAYFVRIESSSSSNKELNFQRHMIGAN